ncbi:MAG: AAA family ATPase [Acidobacteria bacterium]|nr:AAA family ATPase [Acidobacteriota bacterium]NIM60344.1 AAA family ATPase [Acidobacteriota bacterium]NIO60345.1 AAA family ATPase [Acidobacteriota bacterium]NIQ31400.1 AAA family ATPase [Acidobacteriota bacterium]NIQ86626.1 AAA family ATPase [Acidobacteriota bacterium]
MRRKEINERSPVRLLEASIHGGLGAGNIGVVVARHGVGKTAFLVGVALDDLMRGRKVLHVSLEESSERVRSFYDEIFSDLAHERELEDVWRVRLELERNRRIHCYLDGTFSIQKLRDAIYMNRDHGDFHPVAIMLDGFPFADTAEQEIDQLREIARELDAELWMTAVSHREDKTDESGIPAPLAGLVDKIDVILQMAHDTKAVHVSLLKDHDNPDVSDLRLALDPTTMLLRRER